MEIAEIKSAIEAILFAAGDPVQLDSIAQALGQDKKTVRAIIIDMKDDWERKKRGILIREANNSFFLATSPEYYEYVSKVFEPRQKAPLSQASLEALAIIAYNQPVTRADVEQIRGVNSDSAINRLLERNLIQEAGRLDAPGRPVLFETTEEFLKSFGLRSLDDLPGINYFKLKQREKEIATKEAGKIIEKAQANGETGNELEPEEPESEKAPEPDKEGEPVIGREIE